MVGAGHTPLKSGAIFHLDFSSKYLYLASEHGLGISF